MDKEKGADECQTPSSNLNANVRTKVSTWVSNFVTEMRIKSPAVVQKWVESIPNDKSESILFATNESIDSKRSQCEENFETLLNNKEQDELEKEVGEKEEPHPQSTSLDSELIKDNSSTETPTTKFWPKIFLSSAFSRTNLHQSNEVNDKAPAPNEIIEPKSTNSTSSILSKSKINEFYNRLSVNKKRYSFIKERRMEAKKILDNAKDRFLSNSQNDISDNRGADLGADVDNEEILTYSESVVSSALAVYDNTIEMEVSTDDFSHLSQSNDNMSADDSFNLSTQSINDRPSSSLLNVGRKIAIGEIGRSTSDNPRLRNKFHLGDIGRSFSEHQDDEAIIIGERNISAPTSSIAIQNNNKSNGSFFERRAYSVSPTQRSLKRGVLSRDHSLSDSPRNRNILCKDSSFQSDSSHCSSVESLLDARKPDPEAILRHLGFGPIHQEDLLSRIPKRFLKPSQVAGIDTEAFMRQQQIASNLHEQSILGYRGLVGNPHVPPSMIVAKMMERFQLSEEKNGKIMDLINCNRSSSASPTPEPNLSDVPDTEL